MRPLTSPSAAWPDLHAWLPPRSLAARWRQIATRRSLDAEFGGPCRRACERNLQLNLLHRDQPQSQCDKAISEPRKHVQLAAFLNAGGSLSTEVHNTSSRDSVFAREQGPCCPLPRRNRRKILF